MKIGSFYFNSPIYKQFDRPLLHTESVAWSAQRCCCRYSGFNTPYNRATNTPILLTSI